MLQTLNCVRMGEVLFDENQQLFVLCNNCHTYLRNVQDFRKHLEKCEGMENLFQQGRQQFKYNTDKCTQLFGKTVKGIKEFLIYDYNDVEITYIKPEENFIDLINIEQELLDPKWYSDLNVEVSNTSPQKSSKQYEELVEAVTPFVQFKENLKNNNNGRNSSKSILVKSCTASNAIETEKTFKNVKFDLTACKARSIVKRKLSANKTVPLIFSKPTTTAEISDATNIFTTSSIPHVKNVYPVKKRKCEPIISNGFVKPITIHPITTMNTTKNYNILPSATMPNNLLINTASRKPTAITTNIIKLEPTKEKQTAQILNKLQNLGLQVKRTQPQPKTEDINSSASNKTDTKTLEILQKLQSKGMKVKILNKQQSTETSINIPASKSPQRLDSIPVQKPISVLKNSAGNVAIRQNFNKNLIIKKVN